MSWTSVHVYYYDGQGQDRLVLEAVRPLFNRLRGHGVEAYFVRHWRQGPHLRLNFQASTETFAGLVRPAVEEIVGGYLRAHPSTVESNPERLLPMHQRLAELEADSGPLLPWYPDNSIQQADYDQRLVALGSLEAADLLADFYTATTDLAFHALDRVRQRATARLETAFDLMVASAHAFCRGGITRGFVSLRSHAEAFLNAWPEARGLRPRWDAHYAEHRGTLTGRTRAVVAALDGAGEPAPLAQQWVEVLTPILRRGEDLLGAGLTLGLRRPPGSDQGETVEFRGFSPLAELSPFHHALESNGRLWGLMEADWFVRYRLALNYLYLHLTRLRVTPTERFLLCHLAANAVEDAYGVSAVELMSA